jgi:hypothetical protein
MKIGKNILLNNIIIQREHRSQHFSIPHIFQMELQVHLVFQVIDTNLGVEHNHFEVR